MFNIYLFMNRAKRKEYLVVHTNQLGMCVYVHFD